ncbi:phosphodiesterase [Rhodoligotrophos defluvii]|uniref:phosphodiesterase n=1 Tax=Rhodoligotrophos defluvii TaxID=2561934 RepID=UPI0010C9D73D|nr:phosphodiesterase [Rhodoligotrophos defluvii]
MLKIIQLTDCHLVPKGEMIFGSDPHQRLTAAVADINRHHGDAALCVVTGDLAHHADLSAYVLLRETLNGLSVPYQLLAGNHDNRATLHSVFPELSLDTNGFVQTVRDTSAGRLIFLDTVEEGVHTGLFCKTRQYWLAEMLETSDNRPVYLFMHHPPFPIALPHIDQYVMTNGDEFARVVAGRPNIRHIFFGHVHRPVSGSWHGIPFSALRGTNHQSWLTFEETRKNICSLEPPAYAVIFLDRDRTIVHYHDYLDANPRYAYDPDAPLDDQVIRI